MALVSTNYFIVLDLTVNLNSYTYYIYTFTHRYMNRRCSFLDTLAAFHFNMGGGEYVTDEQGKWVCTDTKQLGSTLMTTMLKEVKDFCDPDIKRNWSFKPHQQVSAHVVEMNYVKSWLTPLLLFSSH